MHSKRKCTSSSTLSGHFLSSSSRYVDKRIESNESPPTMSETQTMNNKNEKTSKTTATTTTNSENTTTTKQENIITKNLENLTMNQEIVTTNKLKAKETPETTTKATPTNNQEETGTEGWVQVSKGPAYEASSDVIGCRVKCVCRPRGSDGVEGVWATLERMADVRGSIFGHSNIVRE